MSKFSRLSWNRLSPLLLTDVEMVVLSPSDCATHVLSLSAEPRLVRMKQPADELEVDKYWLARSLSEKAACSVVALVVSTSLIFTEPVLVREARPCESPKLLKLNEASTVRSTLTVLAPEVPPKFSEK